MPYLIRSILLLLIIIAKPVFAQTPVMQDIAPTQNANTAQTQSIDLATEGSLSESDSNSSKENNKTDVMDAKTPEVVMKTTMGTLVITLYPEKAPLTVANFLAYVDDGFYDNTIFHRVIPGFVIQGGGFETGMHTKRVNAAIKNESDNGLTNQRGTLSMARTQNPDSATSQFFINLGNNTSLDPSFNKPGYAVFAKVTDGLPIIDMISRVRTGSKQQFQDVPLDPVLILSVERKSK